jgi:hypothetical protein
VVRLPPRAPRCVALAVAWLGLDAQVDVYVESICDVGDGSQVGDGALPASKWETPGRLTARRSEETLSQHDRCPEIGRAWVGGVATATSPRLVRADRGERRATDGRSAGCCPSVFRSAHRHGGGVDLTQTNGAELDIRAPVTAGRPFDDARCLAETPNPVTAVAQSASASSINLLRSGSNFGSGWKDCPG